MNFRALTNRIGSVDYSAHMTTKLKPKFRCCTVGSVGVRAPRSWAGRRARCSAILKLHTVTMQFNVTGGVSQRNEPTSDCHVVFTEFGVELYPQGLARSEANTAASRASCYHRKHNFTHSDVSNKRTGKIDHILFFPRL